VDVVVVCMKGGPWAGIGQGSCWWSWWLREWMSARRDGDGDGWSGDEGPEFGIQPNSSRTPDLNRKEEASVASFSRKSRCFVPFRRSIRSGTPTNSPDHKKPTVIVTPNVDMAGEKSGLSTPAHSHPDEQRRRKKDCRHWIVQGGRRSEGRTYLPVTSSFGKEAVGTRFPIPFPPTGTRRRRRRRCP
jgi:hypothetical protein